MAVIGVAECIGIFITIGDGDVEISIHGTNFYCSTAYAITSLALARTPMIARTAIPKGMALAVVFDTRQTKALPSNMRRGAP